jgi:hypothetical protein
MEIRISVVARVVRLEPEEFADALDHATDGILDALGHATDDVLSRADHVALCEVAHRIANAIENVLSCLESSADDFSGCGEQPAAAHEAGVKSGVKARSVKAATAGGKPRVKAGAVKAAKGVNPGSMLGPRPP